ncbi:hypothetical protein TWF481_002103 [Arthrobotrys musiformis]|uniref:F-box domain-containing protein n=1 Tax=Arthrobotrys musiformis TaxID=47236 RepID=A0AAV9VUE4_9PEZI
MPCTQGDLLQTSRVEKILSKRAFFATIDGFDDLVRFSKCLAFACRLKHLTLDLSSPRFNFNFGQNYHEIYCVNVKTDPNKNPLAPLTSYVARKVKDLSLDGGWYGNHKVPPRDNSALIERLEEALKRLPNLSTLEFTDIHWRISHFDLAPEETEYVVDAWGKYNPHRSLLAPDWRTKIRAGELVKDFDRSKTGCHRQTIYADTLMAVTKTATKLSQIKITEGLTYDWFGVQLSDFHGKTKRPQAWIGAYKNAFTNLREIHLHLSPHPGQTLSPVLFPTVENIEVLRLSYYINPNHSYRKSYRTEFPFPKKFHLPKLKSLEIPLACTPLEDITSFLICHKDTLKVFRTSDSSDIRRSRAQVIKFLKEMYNHMSFTDFYMQSRMYKFTPPEVQPQGHLYMEAWYRNPYNNFSIRARGDWQNDDASPFEFSVAALRSGLGSNSRLRWVEFIREVRTVEFERPPPSTRPFGAG